MGEIAEALRRAVRERGMPAERPDRPSEVGVLRSTVSRVRPLVARHEIPRQKEDLWIPRAVLVEEGAVAERFRHLAVRVRKELQRADNPILLVTSASQGEGKTTTSCNLALALASIAADRRIALVELDLRRPALARALGIESPPGVERVLKGELSVAEACVSTEVSSLDVYPVRDSDPRAYEQLARPSLGLLLDELSGSYDAVVCDTPPVVPVPDVALLAEHVGLCLIVARSGATRTAAFREMLDSLPRERVIGTFLNESSRRRTSYDHYSYHEDPPR